MSEVMQYKGYLAALHFSAEDEVFHGKIIGINDLIVFEGSSVRELKKAFRESIEDYLETCRALKKQPDKTYKGSFNVRISSDLHREAAIFAAIKNMTLNDFVKNAISYALNKPNRDVSSIDFSNGAA